MENEPAIVSIDAQLVDDAIVVEKVEVDKADVVGKLEEL
jgi:hypothetical protein